MVIVHATMPTKPGRRGELLEPAKACIEQTLNEAGCISYELFFSAADPNKAIMVERWESAEALGAHLQSAHLAKLGADIADILAGGLDVVSYEVVQH
jgi:quinol monooxygenase YgiN